LTVCSIELIFDSVIEFAGLGEYLVIACLPQAGRPGESRRAVPVVLRAEMQGCG
jgi:hypothetical protein